MLGEPNRTQYKHFNPNYKWPNNCSHKAHNFYSLFVDLGEKGDWDFRVSDLVKNLDGTDIINPCGKFQWNPEGPGSQIYSHHLLIGAPGIFSDLLRFVLMLKRERERGVRKATGSYCTYSSLVKLQPRFLTLQCKTSLWAELQPWCLSLQWLTCPWAEHWWLYMIVYIYIYIHSI